MSTKDSLSTCTATCNFWPGAVFFGPLNHCHLKRKQCSYTWNQSFESTHRAAALNWPKRFKMSNSSADKQNTKCSLYESVCKEGVTDEGDLTDGTVLVDLRLFHCVFSSDSAVNLYEQNHNSATEGKRKWPNLTLKKGEEEKKRGNHWAWMRFKRVQTAPPSEVECKKKKKKIEPACCQIVSIFLLHKSSRWRYSHTLPCLKALLCWQNIQGFSVSLTRLGKSKIKRGKENLKGGFYKNKISSN